MRSTREKAGVLVAHPTTVSPKVRLGQSFVVMPHGLAVEGQPSLDEWLEVGTLLNKASDSVHWWIGDWLNYGMGHYKRLKRLTYEQATEMLEEKGLALKPKTLRNDKYVAKQVPLSQRWDKLAWAHHLEVAPLPPDQQQYWLSLAKEKEWSTRELRAAIKGAEDLPWLRYTDVWNFSECDDRFGLKDFDGRIPGQIVQNVLYYYTEPGAFVIDPMAGGGTTLDVCQKCDEVRRECLAFDVEPLRPDIDKADAREPWPINRDADLVFIDPPYWSQMEKAYGGMASEPLDEFLARMALILQRTKEKLKENGTLALLIAPMAIKTDYIDLPFILYEEAKGLGFILKRRIHVAIGSQQVGPAITKHCKDTRTMVALARDLLIMQR